MKYFLDTEFFERPRADRSGSGTIDLISIGIVRDDGAELYLENGQFDWGVLTLIAEGVNGPAADTPKWLLENVRPHLLGGAAEKTVEQIRADVLQFTSVDDKSAMRFGSRIDTEPEFWGYFCDYDWVIFCWLFGRMIDLPPHFPKYCMDLKQVMKMLGVKREELPNSEADGPKHNALNDARWNKLVYEHIANTHPGGILL